MRKIKQRPRSRSTELQEKNKMMAGVMFVQWSSHKTDCTFTLKQHTFINTNTDILHWDKQCLRR